ncbi:Hsp20/alpha crystallin family protein [Thalassobacillus devorans]|uniref:Hsp20/alpha crystallin family protein n=1 Tax=Thalassobacillus devorans TaxID=279813 RepID=UPI000A1CE704|nr:Hsp20/alpha crystallin family protein [Thalassobacillus devorans]
MGSKKNNLPNLFDERFYDFLRSVDTLFDKTMKQLKPFFHSATIPVNIQETKTEVIVKAELPEFDKDQVRVEISGNQLWILAEKKEIIETIDEANNHYHKEQSVHTAEQSITLPFLISQEETSTYFENGILTIVTPKRKRMELPSDYFWM